MEGRQGRRDDEIPLGSIVTVARVMAWVVDTRVGEVRREMVQARAEMEAKLSDLRQQIVFLKSQVQPEICDRRPPPVDYMRHEAGQHLAPSRLQEVVRRLKEGIEPAVVAEDLDMTEDALMRELKRYAESR